MLDTIAFIIVAVFILVLTCLALLSLCIIGMIVLDEEREEGVIITIPRAIMVGLWRLVKWPLASLVGMLLSFGCIALLVWALSRVF